MCSYNRLNQTYACENSYLLNGLVKEQLGASCMSTRGVYTCSGCSPRISLMHRLVPHFIAFDGLVMSDWAANTRDIDAALAGLDMVMPGFKVMQMFLPSWNRVRVMLNLNINLFCKGLWRRPDIQ